MVDLDAQSNSDSNAVELLGADDVIPLAVYETTADHKGAKVDGKGCYRDAVRSTHVYTAYKR